MGKIKFEIPLLVACRVTVYDILGREVAILLDEKLNPGRYELEVKDAGLPEGVYFCKIAAEGISETRKIEIIK